jgi:vacuolar iron transporter family protein
MEREVTAVLGPLGVDEKLCRQVAQNLREVEMSTETVAGGVNLRWSKDVGLTAFLLKFGEGLQEVPTKRLFTSAFTIGMGYLLGGLIPLLPYFFTPSARTGLFWSCILTGVILLIFGFVSVLRYELHRWLLTPHQVKCHVTGAGKGWKGYTWGAVSTLMVGGTAAGAAYGIVAVLET